MGPAPKPHTPCNQHFIDVEPGKISENRARAFDWVRESGKDKPGLTVPSPSPSLLRLSSPHHPVLLVQKALTSLLLPPVLSAGQVLTLIH